MKRRTVLVGIGAVVALPVGARAAPAAGGETGRIEGRWQFVFDRSGCLLLDLKFPFGSSYVHSQVAATAAGLGVWAAAGAERPARFEVVRDAGTFVCDNSRRGDSGTVAFEPDARFVAYLRSLGFNAPTSREHLELALFNVDARFAAGVRSSIPSIEPSDLVRLRVFCITLDDVTAAQRAAHDKLSIDAILRYKFSQMDATISK